MAPVGLIAKAMLIEQLNGTVFGERLIAFLTLAFGLLAAVLASVGLYGVMAYVVARRTREIGIRVGPLGRCRKELGLMILWQAAQLALIGAIIGLCAANPHFLGLIRFQLFGVKPERSARAHGIVAHSGSRSLPPKSLGGGRCASIRYWH